MKNKDRVEMLLLLIQNMDVFSWSTYEVPGVDLEFIMGWTLLFPLKKQKLRRLAKEHV